MEKHLERFDPLLSTTPLGVFCGQGEVGPNKVSGIIYEVHKPTEASNLYTAMPLKIFRLTTLRTLNQIILACFCIASLKWVIMSMRSFAWCCSLTGFYLESDSGWPFFSKYSSCSSRWRITLPQCKQLLTLSHSENLFRVSKRLLKGRLALPSGVLLLSSWEKVKKEGTNLILPPTQEFGVSSAMHEKENENKKLRCIDILKTGNQFLRLL